MENEISVNCQLGIPILDQQHEQIINLANKLLLQVEEKCSNQLMLVTATELIELTQQHFLDEESYFDRLPKRDRKLHLLQHKHILEELLFVKNQLHNEDFVIGADIYGSFVDWFVIHIECEDSKLINGIHTLPNITSDKIS